MEDNVIIYAYNKGYRVLKNGSLINKNGKLLKITFKNQAYKRTTIKYYGKLKSLNVHRLQAYQKFKNEMFLEGIVVRHLNGNPSDNSWENIAIGTKSDNAMDIKEDVRIYKAIYASSFRKKYNHDDIYEFHKKHNSYKLTMNEFKISSKGTLFFILNKFNKLE